jgi:H+/Cl- antiporter ClcA
VKVRHLLVEEGAADGTRCVIGRWHDDSFAFNKFGPSLVIGGALGAALGQACVLYLPGVAPDLSSCIMVGMGGFFAGVAKVPFASAIMVIEMTGSYCLLVPSLWTSSARRLLATVGSPHTLGSAASGRTHPSRP